MAACPVATLITSQAVLESPGRPPQLRLQPQFNPHVFWVSDSDAGPLF